MNKTLTVFTPTYNRAYCLHLLYESLSRQDSQDFIWLVIDDGSVDNTKELVAQWITEGKIEIEYHYKQNGGMHTGHNAAYSLISTPLNVCIDSDDYMPDDAVKKILTLWEQHGSEHYAGLIGLNLFPNGTVIGSKFPDTLKVSTYSALKAEHGVVGDKKIVYRTAVVKRYNPYPEYAGEKFVPLYLPNIVDKDFELLCYNEVFCIVDYQLDGSTINIYNQYFKNPKGFSQLRRIQMKYVPYYRLKFKSAIHYVFTSIISRDYNFIRESPQKIFTVLAIPFGIILYFYLLKKRNAIRQIDRG